MFDRYGVMFYYRQGRLALTQNGNELWYPAITMPYHDVMPSEYACPLAGLPKRAQVSNLEQVYRYSQVPTASRMMSR